jgi:hypothetical protein
MKNDLDSRILGWALIACVVFLAVAYYGMYR